MLISAFASISSEAKDVYIKNIKCCNMAATKINTIHDENR